MSAPLGSSGAAGATWTGPESLEALAKAQAQCLLVRQA